MAKYDFDTIINRRTHGSAKWSLFDEDVLPMWVADMDFVSPPSVMQAIHERTDVGHFGYTMDSEELKQIICLHMQERYGWQITSEQLLFSPGLVVGLNIIAKAIGQAGDAIIMNTPVYGPFTKAPGNNQRFSYTVDMIYVQDDEHTFHYEIDWDGFEYAAKNPQTKLFYMCNPHNPGGFMWREADLRRAAEICIANDIIICADEIHHDLILDDEKHRPLASLSEEISQHTITMIAPSKTYNIPGMGASAFIIQNDDLRKRVHETLWANGLHVNILGFAAAVGAYRNGDEWLAELLPYLRENRDLVVKTVREEFPKIKTTVPEATYLAWLDFRDINFEGNLQQHFIDEAKVALSPGNFFGHSGEGFLRLNFGCPRPLLEDGLGRLKQAIQALD